MPLIPLAVRRPACRVLRAGVLVPLNVLLLAGLWPLLLLVICYVAVVDATTLAVWIVNVIGELDNTPPPRYFDVSTFWRSFARTIWPDEEEGDKRVGKEKEERKTATAKEEEDVVGPYVTASFQ